MWHLICYSQFWPACVVSAALLVGGKIVTTEEPLVPLNVISQGTYREYVGGLYAEGRNEPWGTHADALRQMTGQIQVLDLQGKSDPQGKIVVVGIGASVCRQIFMALEELGPTAKGKRPEVVFVNCAKGGHDVNKISDPERRYWTSAKATVEKAGFSPAQVQVAWYQSDDLCDARDDFPGRPQRLKDGIARNMREAKEHFPNLRICYHSARHTTAFMPDTAAKKKHGEPRPYYVGWAVKWLIEEQAAGKADLRFEGKNTVAPLIAWATYFWTDGDTMRHDDYHWTASDVVKDGIHLSATDRSRVARELLDFWRTDAFAKTWFTSSAQSTDSIPAAQSFADPGPGKAKPQIAAAQSLKPGEPALLVNGKSKFAKLERLLGTRDSVKLVVFDMEDRQVLAVEDVFHKRMDLNRLLLAGNYRLHFLNKDGQRIQMTIDVPDVVRLR